METTSLRIIARIHSEFPTKFGIPRQSGLIDSRRATIVFEPEFRSPEALRGIEGYTHLWLLWQFSECVGKDWSPTVRPPRLGGNRRVGVFATRAPYRPNPIGLSSVKLEEVRLNTPDGPTLVVSGADLMDGTPIYDIKPYLAYVDSHPEATDGFALSQKEGVLAVDCPDELLLLLPESRRQALLDVLSQDPRPQYQNDPERVYQFEFAGVHVEFSVDGDVLAVKKIVDAANNFGK
ncbi:MAG: tRNA (N6-threonylcarbamoyladenosine(37)-N6)-methyltransferase TrmO [Clostridia bacterium]|nr:tRNA (N6-threonylcarbamoyladenosine(37)-N6)-methyltransferase TrmO [Clostridia bacterium]